MPSPHEGESRDEFVDRCIPVVIEEGTAEDGDQAAAICHTLFDEGTEGKSKKLRTKEKKYLADLELKDLHDHKGIVEFYFAAWTTDLDNDQIQSSAYNKTIKENKNRIYHNRDHFEAVGTPVAFGIDETGAWAASQLAVKTIHGRDMFEQYKAGIVKGHSQEFETILSDIGEKSIRMIKEVRLWGITSVTKIPANLDTPTISVKNYKNCLEELKSINNLLKAGNISDELGIEMLKEYKSLYKALEKFEQKKGLDWDYVLKNL